MELITISTSQKQELIDITSEINEIVKKSRVKDGICAVFAKHATGAIVINENYDPNCCLDLLDALNKLIPSGVWRHDKVDGNADSHIKASILGPSETIPIQDGKLELGRWQGLAFCEFDGPRQNREILVAIVPK